MEFFSLTTLFFSLLLLSFSTFFFISLTRKNPHNDHIGFKNYPLIGVIPGFLINRYRFLDWTTEVLSKCKTHTAPLTRPGGVRSILTANPSNVEYILKTSFETYPKGDRFVGVLRDLFGHGLLNSDGESWKIHRNMAGKEFNSKSLRNLVMDNVIVEIKERLVPMMERAVQLEQVLDLQNVFERFAFDNICKLVFNFDPCSLGKFDKTDGDDNHDNQFKHLFEVAMNLSYERYLYVVPNLWRLKRFFNFGSEKIIRDSISQVHKFADDIIKSAMDGGEKHEDLLSRYIRNGDHSPEFLQDVITNSILAGYDTISAALSWFFWILSKNTQVEKKILRELESIRATSSRTTIKEAFTLNELREMHYLHAAISESMRLYPPVPINTRTSEKDDRLPDGTFVSKNAFVLYNTYAMGRMESIWGKDCLKYRPERWIDDETGMFRSESPFKYPVFHAGPRMCIGKDMAYIQMKSIAALVIERFVVDVQNKNRAPEHMLSLTLRIKGGLHVKVKARST